MRIHASITFVMLMKYDVLGTVTKELHSTTIYIYKYD